MLSLVLWMSIAASITPVGNPESVAWGESPGYGMTSEGVTFAITGPTKVLVNVAGEAALRGKKVNVEIIRDDTFLSANQIRLRNRKGGPKNHPAQGAVGFEVPDGEHTYQVRCPAHRLVISLTPKKRIAKRLRAKPETKLETTTLASVPAPAQPESPPPLQPESPSPPQPDPTSPPQPELSGATPASPEALPPAEAEALTEIAAVSADFAAQAQKTTLQKAKRVAVYDLELQGISETIGAVVTDSLVSEIRKLEGISVIGMDEIRDMLSHEANKQFLGCESDESCLAEIAGALGVDDLITGKLAQAADGHVILIRRIDQIRAKVIGSFDQRLKAGTGQEFLLSIGPAVEELFPEHALRPGKQRGVAEEVALRLDPPPLPPWSFYTAAGAAVAAAAAGGVFGLLANTSESAFNKEANRDGSILGRDLVDLESEANNRALAANVSYATAGAFAISAAVIFLFTDWHGYGSELQRN